MIRDLREQANIMSRNEILKRLVEFKLEPKFSAGIWYFSPANSRFHETYGETLNIDERLEIVLKMYDEKAIGSDFRIEAHYPNEINEENIDKYKRVEKETGIKVITVIPNLFYDKIFEFGSLSSPIKEVRDFAIDRTIKALKMNKELDTHFMVVWPGIDGYENPFGTDFYGMWERFETGLAQAMDEVPGVRVAIEPKPYEPRGNNIYRNTANGILMARNVEKLLKSSENRRLLEQGHAMVALNPEVGHVLMGHEELAYAFASILREGRLAHTHWNSQPLGNYDQDLNVGVLALDQLYAALFVLKMHGYNEYFGIDINPERMPVDVALKLNMRAIRAACKRLNNISYEDYSKIVDAMFNPEKNRGLVEEILTKSFEQ
ncbi:MAG: TIM barrel protein [Candidatus Brockarchaeota archaeon]|nr:TIM barrel protein [Candidatus Brockarchaeota archaeon]